jgi:MOSC domain-containing protein YiiM
METILRVISIQVGRVVEYPPVEAGGAPWRSGIGKKAVEGAVWARRTGLDGDEQADLRAHGGEGRAINVYPAEHYDFWRQTHAFRAMSGGAFGENFTTLGLVEQTACIGDVFRVGDAVVEITQPRGPCYKLNRKWGVTDLQQRAEMEHRFGWYLRVKQEGRVSAGDALELLERPNPQWTVARVWDIKEQPALDRSEVAALVAIPALAEDWKKRLLKKIQE